MLRDSVVVVIVVRTHPRAIPLAMITIRKSFMGFLFFPVMTMGLCLAALWAAGAPLIYIEDITRWQEDMDFMFEWQELYLTSERSERVRYSSCHENIKSISSS